MILSILLLGAVANAIFTFNFARAWKATAKELKAHRDERRVKTAVLHDLHKRTLREKIKYTFVFGTNTLAFLCLSFKYILAIYGL